MKRIFHWSEYAWGLAKQYGIDPENEPDRYQPFFEMAEQLWADIASGKLKGRRRSGTLMEDAPSGTQFSSKSHSYFTADELNKWRRDRGFLFDDWKAPASAATSPLKKPTNSKRDYAAEVAKVWAAAKALQSSRGNPVTERDLAQAVAEEFQARGFNGPQGHPLSAETIRKSYNPNRR
jgi:hypothetical protein